MVQLYQNQLGLASHQKVLHPSGQVLSIHESIPSETRSQTNLFMPKMVAICSGIPYNTPMQNEKTPQTPQDQALQRLLEKLRTPELMAVLKRLADK
jgi:hypothetical protein